MRIKKITQTTPVLAQVLDNYSESTDNTYSCNFINNIIGNEGIVESGSNSNGSYIKYSDGTMICCFEKRLTAAESNFSRQYGSAWLNSAEITWTFPVEFYGIPTVTATGYFRGGVGAFNLSGGPDSTTVKGWLHHAQAYNFGAGGDNRAGVDFMAMGRWKA